MSDKPTRACVEVICPFDTAPASVAAAVADFLADCGRHADAGKARKLSAALARSGERHFQIELGSVKAEMGGVRHYDHTRVALESGEPLPWSMALSHFDSFILGRVYDYHYDLWQNAEDPLVYRAADKSMDGLPLKSNGLPFPLTQQVIDTSRNPGRRVLRRGYVEAIGHRAWLSPHYFARVPGADREAIANVDWLEVSVSTRGYVEVVAADEPFVDESTAALQNRLRKQLFPTTAT